MVNVRFYFYFLVHVLVIWDSSVVGWIRMERVTNIMVLED